MLKRSPRSRATTILLTIGAILAFFIVSDSLLTMRSLTKNHGKRISYFMTTAAIHRGDKINTADLSPRELFSADAPPGSIKESDLSSMEFAVTDIPSHTILTKNMVGSTASQSVHDDKRLIFIPTQEKISRSTGNRTDLISVITDGYGASYIATNARILFDLTPADTTEDGSAGYWVEVTQDEASDIAEALATGEVHFALTHDRH